MARHDVMPLVNAMKAVSRFNSSSLAAERRNVIARAVALSFIHNLSLRSEIDPGDGEVEHSADGGPENLRAGRRLAGAVDERRHAA